MQLVRVDLSACLTAHSWVCKMYCDTASASHCTTFSLPQYTPVLQLAAIVEIQQVM